MVQFFIGLGIGLIVGIAVFVVLLVLWLDKVFLGYLREDHSIAEDRPYYFMEIWPQNKHKLHGNKYFLLKAKRENYMDISTK